jgi:mRNA interferase MazF
MKRGEVWWADLPAPWGRRPVLLLARDEAYEVLTWVVAAPLTTTIRRIPSAVVLDPKADGVPQPCAVALDNLQAVRVEWLRTSITKLSADRMAAVERALHFALGLRS